MTDRVEAAVRLILADAARAAVVAIGDGSTEAIDFGPDAEDLGEFELPGRKSTDAIATRRIAIGYRVFRLILWEEQKP